MCQFNQVRFNALILDKRDLVSRPLDWNIEWEQGNDFQTHEYIPEVKNLLMRSYQSTDMLGLLFCTKSYLRKGPDVREIWGKRKMCVAVVSGLGQIAVRWR